MELTINLRKEFDEYVAKLAKNNHVSNRRASVRKTVCLLISPIHDEHYDVIDAFIKVSRH